MSPAAEREGRRQGVAQADAAMRPRPVDQDPAHRHLPGEGHRQLQAAGVDDRRVAAAAVAEDLPAQPDAVVLTVSGEQREDGGELFPAVRTRHGLAGHRSHEQASAGRNCDAGPGGDGRGSLSEHGAAQAPIAAVEGGPRQAIAFRGTEHGRAGPLQGGGEAVAHGPVDDQVVLRAADDAVIKGLAGHHHPGGCLDVGIRADPGRRVARPDSDRGRTGAVRRLDHRRPARGQDHRHAGVAHQRRGGPAGGAPRGTLHQVGRRSVPGQDLAEQVHGPGPDACRVAVAADDERVPRLDADQGLEHQRGHRVGHRDEPQDDAHGLGDLGQRLPLIAADDAHARLPDQRLRHIQAREPVLVRLVRHAAEACLGHGRRGQLIGMARDLRGERHDEAVYLALRPAGDAVLGRDRPCDERIHSWIRLFGDDDLLTVPGEDASILRGSARQPAQHHDHRR